MLPGEVLGASHDLGDAAVDELQFPFLARFAFKAKPQRGTAYLDMSVTQRRQAEALVVAGIGGIADTDHRVVEEPDNRGQHPFARETAAPQIRINRGPKPRQRLGKGREARIFDFIAAGQPAFMIAILFAAALVAARSLDMAVRITRNPYIRPGWRYRQTSDAGKRL